MKYMNLLKRLSAVITVVAMIGTLGMTALAANTAVDDAWEKDYAVTGAMDITAVNASYVPVGEGAGAYKDYTIKINYTCSETAQVTVLGYVYSGDGIPADAPALDTSNTASIYAVNQQAAGEGVAVIKLTSNPDAAKAIDEEALLVVKMGTDDATYSAAQAVMIKLANAKEIKEPVEIESVTNPEDIFVPYGAATADVALPATVKVTGIQGGAAMTGSVDAPVVWNTEGLAATVTDTIAVTGTVQVDDVEFTNDDEDDLTVTVNIKWESLGKDAAIANSVTVSVPVGTPVEDIEALVKKASVGLKLAEDGEVVETVSLADAVISEITYTGAEEVGATATAKATLASAGVEGEDIFVLIDYEVTVTLNVVEAAPDVIYGDVNGDEAVNMQDVVLALQGYMEKAVLDDKQNLAADVNGDKAVNMQDVVLILQKYMEKIANFPVEQ